MSTLELFTPDQEELLIPLAEGVKAGFPSPAEDFSQVSLNISSEIVKNPSSTFYARISGTSMIDDGIGDGDILVIDKSIEPFDGCIAICFIDGEFTLKHVERHEDYLMLVPANHKFKPIKVTSDNDFIIWGVATFVIHKV